MELKGVRGWGSEGREDGEQEEGRELRVSEGWVA